MREKGLRKLPQDLAKAVLSTAEKNYEKNKDLLEGEDKKKYMLGYLHGFEAAWAMYTEDDEEVLRIYDGDKH